MIVLLHGPDEYRRSERLRVYLATIPEAARSLNISRIEGKRFKLDAFIQASEAFPFLHDRRIVVVEDLLKNQKAGKERDEFKQVLERLTGWCDVIFVENEDIDKRGALDELITAIVHRPEAIANTLDARMATLSADQRFEDAALVRDRLQAFTQAITRQQLNEQLRRAGVVDIRIHDHVHRIDHGILVETRGHDALFDPLRYATTSARVLEALHAPAPPTALDLPIPTAVVDEISLVARHIKAHQAHVEFCEGAWYSTVPSAQPALGDSWRTASQKSISGSSGKIANDDVVTPLAK
jgi:hypothetical protein